ncbi:helix-turn-helix domain-containing protein [Flavisphingomonas formosensis]|uniref:helix-turn-helix domain-containing protein n=1 Tax=Flavisphingomonas formosensis TaxID=861534 RepID=UPI0012FB280B|nr:helix-turn-helix domain-containing protein [Sphingomonas formosensis]
MPSRPATIPTFYLYGEPDRLVAQGFVHLENLDDRTRPSEWTIQPHAHAELSHVFVVNEGGGALRAEAGEIGFSAPCLLLVPAGVVHGFGWFAESSGWVLTLAGSYLSDLLQRNPDLAMLFKEPCAVALDEALIGSVEAILANLSRELGWAAPGHRAAVEAALLSLMVIARRQLGAAEGGYALAEPSHHAAIVARLRERIEQRFRLREPVSAYAAALGVSATALRVACSRVAGASPTALLDQRALLEAKRALLYSNLSVAEIGYSVGMVDPAYFSRFFARHVGRSPKRYREESVSARRA